MLILALGFDGSTTLIVLSNRMRGRPFVAMAGSNPAHVHGRGEEQAVCASLCQPSPCQAACQAASRSAGSLVCGQCLLGRRSVYALAGNQHTRGPGGERGRGARGSQSKRGNRSLVAAFLHSRLSLPWAFIPCVRVRGDEGAFAGCSWRHTAGRRPLRKSAPCAAQPAIPAPLKPPRLPAPAPGTHLGNALGGISDGLFVLHNVRPVPVQPRVGEVPAVAAPPRAVVAEPRVSGGFIIGDLQHRRRACACMSHTNPSLLAAAPASL
jgi:hypothetical protein